MDKMGNLNRRSFDDHSYPTYLAHPDRFNKRGKEQEMRDILINL
jgi:hypothetical protein